MVQERELMFAIIATTILILMLVIFIIVLVVMHRKQFKRGVRWAEENSLGYAEWQVKMLTVSAFSAGRDPRQEYGGWWDSTASTRATRTKAAVQAINEAPKASQTTGP